ncbi:MAG: (2Fe-2S) ferredoxin domain-containing protein [Lachnospiraceae bacterium]|nr:(2Fe-2S) ferredoxin domain-containing protein [Lachnospiraceae bacterium]
MLFIEICVGSSCHLKGAPRVVELLKEKIEKNHLEDDIMLTGAFCSGRCNREGVTITVGEEVYTGITPETLGEFWEKTVWPAVIKAREV